MPDRFEDRLDRSNYSDDEVIGIHGTDPDDADALWIPHRLFRRLSFVALPYELHTLPPLGDEVARPLQKPQVDDLIDDLQFVAARLNDEVALRVISELAQYLTARTHIVPPPDPVAWVEGP